ncbi:MAG: Mut7-C RNAse domain-containing protein, partial [Desulfocapsaceae bacterium]
SASIKDIIEAMGIPHTEIGAIEKSTDQLDFSYIPQPGDRIDIRAYPAGCTPTEPTVLRPLPLSSCRFMVDINVARLARLLRMAGFDTESLLDSTALSSKRDIAEASAARGRILLSRDKELLKHRQVTFGRLVRTQDPKLQLVEIINLYGLHSEVSPFSRCLKCNAPLVTVTKESVAHRLEPLTKKYYDSFKRCGSCSSIYWRGSHHQHMLDLIKLILPDTSHH